MLINNSGNEDLLPLEFYLSQNYPNPFSEKTTIKFCVPYRTRVQITVYNSEGKLIVKLVNEEKKPGTYEVEFSASACYSHESGNLKERTYYYDFEAGDYKTVKEMQLQK